MITPCMVSPDGEHWWIEASACSADRECLRCGADWTGDTDAKALVGIIRAKDDALSQLRTAHLELQMSYRAALRNGRVLRQVQEFRDWVRAQAGPVDPSVVERALMDAMSEPES